MNSFSLHYNLNDSTDITITMPDNSTKPGIKPDQNICTEFSLNIPDFTSQTWKCPNC